MPIGHIVKIVDNEDFSTLPIFSLNATAVSGGLAVGTLYKTPTGQLMVVY